uniref:Uncharacterized protein n=1 Tax=Rhizophora mucronata TaxID=61149 RepID=A0A2P2J271_RHIMU
MRNHDHSHPHLTGPGKRTNQLTKDQHHWPQSKCRGNLCS